MEIKSLSRFVMNYFNTGDPTIRVFLAVLNRPGEIPILEINNRTQPNLNNGSILKNFIISKQTDLSIGVKPLDLFFIFVLRWNHSTFRRYIIALALENVSFFENERNKHNIIYLFLIMEYNPLKNSRNYRVMNYHKRLNQQ